MDNSIDAEDTESGEESSAALAFVDVLTNALGGVLVLFFIAVLFRERLTWSNIESSFPPGKADHNEPFVIVITCDPPSFDTGESVLSVTGPAGNEASKGTTIDWSKNHALLVLERPPKVGSTVLVSGANKPTRLRVEYFMGTTASLVKSDIMLLEGETQQVWPLESANAGN